MGVTLSGEANRESPVRAEPHPTRSFAYLRRGPLDAYGALAWVRSPGNQCPEGSETPRNRAIAQDV